MDLRVLLVWIYYVVIFLVQRCFWCLMSYSLLDKINVDISFYLVYTQQEYQRIQVQIVAQNVCVSVSLRDKLVPEIEPCIWTLLTLPAIITAETVHSAVFGLVLFPNSEQSLTITAEATDKPSTTKSTVLCVQVHKDRYNSWCISPNWQKIESANLSEEQIIIEKPGQDIITLCKGGKDHLYKHNPFKLTK